MARLDVLLVDRKDVGCRIYTFLTTLRYLLEECAARRKAVWVLDRPNPAGRPVEGLRLREGWESFVGAGPLPMRHGVTLGEAARWFAKTLQLDIDLQVVKMQGWKPDSVWPTGRSWVNPSPKAASRSMARCYAGASVRGGTRLS